MVIAGPTLSGKSHFCKNLIQFRKDLFNVEFSRIKYCTHYSSLKTNFITSLQEIDSSIEIGHEIPNLEKDQFAHDDSPKLVVLDDLILDVSFTYHEFNLNLIWHFII